MADFRIALYLDTGSKWTALFLDNATFLVKDCTTRDEALRRLIRKIRSTPQQDQGRRTITGAFLTWWEAVVKQQVRVEVLRLHEDDVSEATVDLPEGSCELLVSHKTYPLRRELVRVQRTLDEGETLSNEDSTLTLRLSEEVVEELLLRLQLIKAQRDLDRLRQKPKAEVETWPIRLLIER